MSDLPSTAFVNGSIQTTGIFRTNFDLFEAAKELGSEASWYQCVDPSDSGINFRRENVVMGWHLPSPIVEMGVNRLWVFPRKLRNLRQRWIVLGDPTFLSLTNRSSGDREILFVHDLRPISPFNDRIAMRWIFRHLFPRIRNVRRVLVYTEYLKSRLEEYPGVRGKVCVLPPHHLDAIQSGEEHIRASLDRIGGRREIVILYVATDRPYKNLNRFFELARCLEKETEPVFRFLLVSRLRASTSRELEANPITNLKVVPYVPDIRTAFQQSDVLVFPSLYEGFGLSIIDAMACGMPVLASDLEPMREVVGDGGSLLDPQNVKPWVEALRSLSDTPRYRAAAQRAWDRSKTYSRDRFFQRLPEVFA